MTRCSLVSEHQRGKRRIELDQELVETAVTVINQVRRTALVDIARIEEPFWDRCGATVRIPWDDYLEAGAETDLADLRPATREAYLQLAASVARRFDV